jgi:hypothetical protein
MVMDAGTADEYVASGSVDDYALPSPTYVGFTGRTGGAHNNHWVKNIVLGGAGPASVGEGAANFMAVLGMSIS